MQCSVKAAELSALLQKAGSFLPRATTLPALTYILLEVSSGKLSCRATDLDNGFCGSIPAIVGIDGEGRVLLPGKLLIDVCKKFTGDMEISVGDNYKATITCGRSKVELWGMPPEQYPEPPRSEADLEFGIEADTLKEALRKLLFVTSNDMIWDTILWDIFNGLSIVATDSHRLAVEEEVAPAEGTEKVLLPAAGLQSLIKTLPQGRLAVEIGKTVVFFRYNDGYVYIVRKNIQYPNYKAVLPSPDSFTASIEVNRLAFQDMLSRVILLTENRKPVATLEVNGSISLTTSSSSGTVIEKIDGDSQGQIKISFNPHYLFEAIQVLEKETVRLNFMDPLKPICIREGKYLHIVLPVRYEE